MHRSFSSQVFDWLSCLSETNREIGITHKTITSLDKLHYFKIYIFSILDIIKSKQLYAFNPTEYCLAAGGFKGTLQPWVEASIEHGDIPKYPPNTVPSVAPCGSRIWITKFRKMKTLQSKTWLFKWGLEVSSRTVNLIYLQHGKWRAEDVERMVLHVTVVI